MSTLITGGTGYIGSHVGRLLTEASVTVVIADDVATGSIARVGRSELLRLDLSGESARDQLVDFMKTHEVERVLHFAGRKQVSESVSRPVWYYRQNLGGLENLLDAMTEAHVDQLVFSSSAAVYGTTTGSSIRETDATNPINPYGETKLAGEWLVHAWAQASGSSAVSLRYFNVAGAGWPDLADTQALNLVPMVFERIDAGLPPLVFGNDYETTDGTCVRDYVHVLDLAEAHIAVLDSLPTRRPGAHHVFNVGTGTGTSVAGMLRVISTITGIADEPVVAPRRSGDPAVVVASPGSIRADLGWSARRGLDEIIRSAWEARIASSGLGRGSLATDDI